MLTTHPHPVLKNVWSYTSTPHVFLAWLSKQWENITVTVRLLLPSIAQHCRHVYVYLLSNDALLLDVVRVML
jgi:hypothetical protein